MDSTSTIGVTNMTTRILYRSAVNGRFVAKRYVNQHPRTTETERRPSRHSRKTPKR